MGAKFDTEHLKMKEGQNLMECLKKAFKEKGQADDKEDLRMILEIVSKKISEGYTSGYEPTWNLEGGSQ